MILILFNILLTLVTANDSSNSYKIESYLEEKLSDYSRIAFTIISPKKLDISNCEIDESRQFKFSGKFAYLPIIENNNSKLSKRSVLTLRLKLYKDVLVANRVIRKKELLNRNDFKVVEKEISELRFEPFNNFESLKLFRSRLKISENSVLQKPMVEKIPDISIGDRVEAIFMNNTVSIRFNVTARSEGVSGSTIKVKRDDKRLFKAKVINNTTVKIIE